MVSRNVESIKHDKVFILWRIGLIAMMALSVMLASCAPSAPASPTATATDEPSSPVPVATATSQPTVTTQALSFQASAYKEKVAGFEFDYAANWTVGPIQQYSRAGITAFTSWSLCLHDVS